MKSYNRQVDRTLQICILDILRDHRGYENRIQREQLRAQACANLGGYVKDRDMRRAIEQLRVTAEGSLIASTCGNGEPGREGAGGYFLAKDVHELDHYIQQDENRAVVILKRLRKQRMAAGMELAGVSALPLEEV